MSESPQSESTPFRRQLAENVDAIADKYLDRQVSMQHVVTDSIEAYTAAWREHRDGEPLDLLSADNRAELGSFVYTCVTSVGEPENPQFPVRRS
ncbi:hypothetical protein GCM10007304_38650 [Rhodococcoides trifolii]|uniref:Uncharacterized protein n=1 Tax=Rhodococcoides trifolii TaxID=908250 RepID=A0A917LGG5_9NOCA|nr:hypothetical protein [Rhodococcus trifolii]GGG21067.1 hypothetical protein GCM10007304_38650 [Rhodococcus trifolii]